MPSLDDVPYELYVRQWPPCGWRLRKTTDDPLAYTCGTTDSKLSFDTFFGALSLRGWRSAKSGLPIALVIDYAGALHLQVWHRSQRQAAQLICECKQYATRRSSIFIQVPEELQKGIVYPVVASAEGGDLVLFSMRYVTVTPPSFSPQIGIIMPTYRREPYVVANIEKFLAWRQENPQPDITLFVIDNGRTLQQSATNGNVRIIPNRNVGGAGGFARGLLEAEAAGCTHVIFCDDDVIIEPEAFARTYAFFSIADQRSVIGGGMLRMGAKHILYELGAIRTSMGCLPQKSNWNLLNQESIIKYDDSCLWKQKHGYFAWWYFASPLVVFAQNKLPMPYFFRGDDQEFAERYRDCKFVTLLGVAVWHDDFEKKDSPVTDYYIVRNGLITGWIHGDPQCPTILSCAYRTCIALLTYRYDRAQFILCGIRDALRGPSWLERLDEEQYHQQLLRTQCQRMQPIEKPTKLPIAVNPPKSLLRKILIISTVNGHLLPACFIKALWRQDDPDRRVYRHLHDTHLGAIFLRPEVCYYEPSTKQGILCVVSPQRFWQIAAQLLWIMPWFISTLFLQRWRWRRAYHRLITPEAWRKRLKLGLSD
ncbi:MAG: glycosyltransferase [Planctomycetota bacterium]|nr:glycosyltransferase [Planctomycetota bacterium]